MHGGDLVVGAVGRLQFEVLDERMKAEYGLEVIFETSPYQNCAVDQCGHALDLESVHR